MSSTSDPGADTLTALPPEDAREYERLSARLQALSGAGATSLSGLPRLDLGEQAELTVRGELGRGAMGRVVLVEQRSLRREVAMKTLADANPTAFSVRALLTEAITMGQLEHPNVVPVHQLGLDERGLPALVLKRISGVSWGALLADTSHPLLRRFGLGEADPLDAHIEILMHVCDAVHFAHQHGVVHRDIKPDNVMVGEHGEVYLVDWGLATSVLEGAAPLARGTVAGTPGYMAPEMAKEQRVDARTDVYLLGATLHFVMTGKLRNQGKTLPELMQRIASPEPVRYDPDLPSELAELANRATAKRPEKRPQSAEEFRAGLAAWRRHQGSHRLRREATVRLAQLQGLRAAGGVAPSELMRLATECRFGFTQALREWPENPEAQQGLRACIKEMIRWAIDHEDAATARSLLHDLSRPSSELTEQVVALERRLQKQKTRAGQAAALAQARDLNVAGQNRLRLIVWLVVSLSAIRLGLIVLRGPESTSDPRTLLGVGGVAFVLLGVGAFSGRRELFRNEVNRQILGMILLMLAGIFANRIHGYTAGLSGPTIMVGDSLIAALSAAMAALSVRRQLVWTVLVNLIGAAASARWPHCAAYAFSISSLSGMVVVAYVLDRYREES